MAVSRLGLFGVASRLGPVWPRGRWPSPGSGLASWALAFAWARAGLVGAALRLVRAGLVGAGPPRAGGGRGGERGIPRREPHSTGRPRPGGRAGQAGRRGPPAA